MCCPPSCEKRDALQPTTFTPSPCLSPNRLPLLRDAGNAPIVLTEEIGVGSMVRMATAEDGTMRAVKVMAVAYDDPFAEAAGWDS
jgi:hypothetical protein